MPRLINVTAKKPSDKSDRSPKDLQTPPRQSTRSQTPPRTSPRRSPRKRDTKITDHFARNVNEVAKKKRGRRAKIRSSVTANKPIIICESRPRTKAQRRAAKGRVLSKSPPPDSPAGRVKKRHAHKRASTAKSYSSWTTSQKKCSSSKSTPTTRKNWSKDPALSEAVKMYWITRDQDKPPSQRDIARDFGIPPGTFGKYVNTNVSKRQELGSQTGPKRILSKDNSEFLCQLAISVQIAPTKVSLPHNCRPICVT